MSEELTTRLDGPSDHPTRPRIVARPGPNALRASPPEAAADDEPDPTRIERFVVLERLGRGGMGVVYAAYDPKLDRKVALKIVRPDRSGSASSGPPGARLLREAQAMAKLAHPNVVAIHEVGQREGDVFLAMEYVHGKTLKTWLKVLVERDPQRRRWRELLAVFLQAGEGLHAAHRAGLVHRDFKPDNVLVGDDGRVRVLDFGLARPDHRPTSPGAASPDLELTAAGAIVGTPGYMAPEQHNHLPGDARSDQYSFCTALYEALAGARPFRGADLHDLGALKSRGDLPPPPRSTRVPRWLWPVLARGLRPDPAQRFPDMGALLTTLRSDPERIRRRIFAVLLSLSIGFTIAFAYGRALERAEEEALAAHLRVCDGVAAAIDTVWNDERRTLLSHRFGGAGLRSWSAIQGRIDDFTSRWTAARTDVCLATRVRGEQSEALMRRRVACLDRALAVMSARLDVLLAADAPALRRAGDVLDASPVELCTSSERNSHIDPPDDPTAAFALVARVDKLRAEVELRGPRASTELAETLAALTRDVEARRYRPLLASLHILRGRVAELTGRYADAELAYAEGLSHAEVSRDDLTAVDALVNLVFVSTFHNRKLREAKTLVPRMRAALERLGDDPNLAAQALRSEAALAGESGDFAAAIELFRRSSDKYREAGLEIRALGTLASTGVFYNRMGQAREAIRLLEPAAAELDGRPDASPPARSTPHINLGRSWLLRGEWDAALTHLRAAEAISREVSETDPGVVLSSFLQGQVLLERGDVAAARPLLERALESRRRSYGPKSSYVVSAAYFLARAQILLGDLDAAAALLAETAAYDPGDGFEERGLAAHGHYVRGLFALRDGEPARAREHLGRALPIVTDPNFFDYNLAALVLLALADATQSAPLARPLARDALTAYLPRLRDAANAGNCSPELAARLERWLADHPG